MTRRSRMGLVYADVTFHGPLGQHREPRMLVDTGSTYTWIPEIVARTLGAREREVIPLELADGRIVYRMLGELEVEILGRRGTRFVVFGLAGDSTLLGVDALEGLRLEVDPARHRLKASPTALAISSRCPSMDPAESPAA